MIIPGSHGVARLKWQAAGDPDPHMITIGLNHDNTVSTDPSGIAADVRDAWASSVPINALSNLYTFLGVDVTLGPVPGDGPTGGAIANTVGTSTAPVLPSNCSLLVAKITALGGRKFRGRFYMPAGFLAEVNVGHDGAIVSATLTGFQGYMDAFVAALVAKPSIVGPVLLHGETTPPSTVPGPTAITKLLVRSTIATQRRRMR